MKKGKQKVVGSINFYLLCGLFTSKVLKWFTNNRNICINKGEVLLLKHKFNPYFVGVLISVSMGALVCIATGLFFFNPEGGWLPWVTIVLSLAIFTYVTVLWHKKERLKVVYLTLGWLIFLFAASSSGANNVYIEKARTAETVGTITNVQLDKLNPPIPFIPATGRVSCRVEVSYTPNGAAGTADSPPVPYTTTGVYIQPYNVEVCERHLEGLNASVARYNPNVPSEGTLVYTAPKISPTSPSVLIALGVYLLGYAVWRVVRREDNGTGAGNNNPKNDPKFV